MLVCSLELPLGSLALFELDRWVRVSLSGEGALSVVLVEYSWRLEEESRLCLAVWLSGSVASVVGYLCLMSAGMLWRGRLRAVRRRSVLSPLSSFRNSARCAEEDETSDAQCQSLSSIGVESLVNVRDSPIPMSMVSAMSLGSYLADKTAVQPHPSGASTIFEELGSRNSRWG